MSKEIYCYICGKKVATIFKGGILPGAKGVCPTCLGDDETPECNSQSSTVFDLDYLKKMFGIGD